MTLALSSRCLLRRTSNCFRWMSFRIQKFGIKTKPGVLARGLVMVLTLQVNPLRLFLTVLPRFIGQLVLEHQQPAVTSTLTFATPIPYTKVELQAYASNADSVANYLLTALT